MRYLGVGFLFAALVAGAMAYQTHEAVGWVFCALFALVFLYITLKK